MKTGAEKSSATSSKTSTPAKSAPFIAKPGSGGFFAPAAPGRQVAVSSEVVNLASGVFAPSQRVKDEIVAAGSNGLLVRVAAKDLAGEGQVKIKADSKGRYDSMSRGAMPYLNPWAQQLGDVHICFIIKDNGISDGFVTFTPNGGKNNWLHSLQKNAGSLGGLGLKINNLPTSVNEFANGTVRLGVTGLKVEVGGFLDAQFSVTLENLGQPQIAATSEINVKGVAKGHLKLDNKPGKLAGEVLLAVEFTAFSGSAKIIYQPDGTVAIEGKAAYNANRLSGEIQFVATDAETARNFTKNAIAAAGGTNNIQTAPPPAPVPAPKPNKKQRALAATGLLAFNLTNWFAGSVNVVVDSEGQVTVIGKIAPPAEIELFKQRDWDKELLKFEAKAYYGIPVVGNLNLFANISLHALASLGPAKIYNIEILGTYSTDPTVQKSIQIAASINISAYAGLRLRAEGGAGIEILSHDLKFGVGVQADVGVKAYADARPVIGFREPGEFYISGTLEMVAQPMLGLSGDFFIALETPWWSPLSDDRWTWPLFSKEWPLTDPIGISASVKEYVLGSGKVPEVELKKPEFDPSKFMTNMVDRSLPDKSGGPGTGQGSFKEDGSVPKPLVPPKKPAPKQPPAKAGKKGAPPKAGKSKTPDPKGITAQEAAKNLQKAAKLLALLKGKEPLTRASLDLELAKIKAQASGISFAVALSGQKWRVRIVAPKTKGNKENMLELAASKPDADKPATELVDNPTRFLGEAHTLRLRANENGVQVLMASNDFKDLQDQLVEIRRTYLGQHPPGGRLLKEGHSDAAAAMDKLLKAIWAKKKSLESQIQREKDVKKRQELEENGLEELEEAIEAMGDFLVNNFSHSFGKGGTVAVGTTIYVVNQDRGYRVLDIGRIMSGELGIYAHPLAEGASLFLSYAGYDKEWSIPAAQKPPPFGGFKGGTGTAVRLAVNVQRNVELGGTNASHTPPGFVGKWNRRGHLVGKQFGGPGRADNIVAMTERANHTKEGIVSIENDARSHIDSGAVITYKAQPVYNGKDYRTSAPDTVVVEVDETWPKPTPVKFRKEVDNAQ